MRSENNMVGFEIGAVPFNPDCWGSVEPSSRTNTSLLPNHPVNVPFAPFSRSEKLGQISDFTPNSNNPRSARGNPADSAFDFTGDDSFAGNADDDASFRLVDGKPPLCTKFGPKWRFNQHYHNNRNQIRLKLKMACRMRHPMWKTDTPTVINTCNGFYCDAFSPNRPYKPTIWTEAWSGWIVLMRYSRR